MFRMLGAAVAAVALAFAGSAGAAVIWSGTVNGGAFYYGNLNAPIYEPIEWTITTEAEIVDFEHLWSGFEKWALDSDDGEIFIGESYQTWWTAPKVRRVSPHVYTLYWAAPPPSTSVHYDEWILDHFGYTESYDRWHVLEIGAYLAPGSDGTAFQIEDTIDWSVVPEPATWALLIGGFGIAGIGLRRARRSRTQLSSCHCSSPAAL